MSFRKVLDTLCVATQAGFAGAAYSAVKGCINLVSSSTIAHNHIKDIEIVKMVNNFLNEVVTHFPSCSLSTDPNTFPGYGCDANDPIQRAQFSALQATAQTVENFATTYQNNYYALANAFFDSAYTTFGKNVGFDSAVFAVVAAAVYLICDYHQKRITSRAHLQYNDLNELRHEEASQAETSPEEKQVEGESQAARMQSRPS